ncbi:MAG: MOSC domain-containing protein [Pseudomonadota bacterium]
MSTNAKITAIRVHPVKSLSERDLETAALTVGEGLANDRRFAICHKASRFDPTAPTWQPKSQFLNLMRHERLAQLESSFDPDTGELTLSRDGRTVAKGDITTPLGRQVINQFLSAFAGQEARGSARLVELAEGSLADRDSPFLSIISEATVRDIERVVRQKLDPKRFRGNLLIDGTEPWAEFEWVGNKFSVGSAELEIIERIGRCAATNVNPTTAERDANIPKALLDGFGHADCGVQAIVTKAGTIRLGDAMTPA